MKTSYFTAVLSLTFLLGFGGSAHAAQNNARSVEIFDVVQIGTTELTPGDYKVEWQGTGPAVKVSFRRNGKTVVTVPGTLKTNDGRVTRDRSNRQGNVNAQRDRFRSSKRGASV
jgi:hypothetical protein